MTATQIPGDVLVTHMTDSGGMTCHAAIVSRELGIPCVVGTGDATSKLREAVSPASAPIFGGAGAGGPAVTATRLLLLEAAR